MGAEQSYYPLYLGFENFWGWCRAQQSRQPAFKLNPEAQEFIPPSHDPLDDPSVQENSPSNVFNNCKARFEIK